MRFSGLKQAAVPGWNNFDAAMISGSQETPTGLVLPQASLSDPNRVKYVPLTGIHGDDHAQRFVDTFEKCYTEDALDLPWYALAGNHDHHGNVSAQIAYTHDQSRWTFPDYWYTFNRTAAGVTTQVIMIDTVTLCGMAYMDEATGEVVSGEAHPMQARAGEQLAWIEATL